MITVYLLTSLGRINSVSSLGSLIPLSLSARTLNIYSPSGFKCRTNNDVSITSAATNDQSGVLDSLASTMYDILGEFPSLLLADDVSQDRSRDFWVSTSEFGRDFGGRGMSEKK